MVGIKHGLTWIIGNIRFNILQRFNPPAHAIRPINSITNTGALAIGLLVNYYISTDLNNRLLSDVIQ